VETTFGTPSKNGVNRPAVFPLSNHLAKGHRKDTKKLGLKTSGLTVHHQAFWFLFPEFFVFHPNQQVSSASLS